VTEHGENDELEEFGHQAVLRAAPLFAWGMVARLIGIN
jgi:hypothetical protein